MFYRDPFLCWMPLVVFFVFTNSALLYDTKTDMRMFVTIGIRFKQHFDTMYFAFCNLSSPKMFLSPDLSSEHRIQHDTIGPLYVTSRYSTNIFYRGVSSFACGVWCSGLTTCLLYVGPLFGNRLLNNNWAVGMTRWTVNLHYFIGISTYVIVYVLMHPMLFWLYICILNSVLYF